MKKIMVYVVAAAMMFTVLGINTNEASAALGYNKIGKVGNATKTVSAGKYFELEVNKGSKVKDSNLWWSVGNSDVVRIADDDRSDDEIDLKAVKAGTTKVTCKNKLTGGKIVYTVKVNKTASYGIKRVGGATKVVKVGNDIEVKVSKGSGLKNNQIKWYIVDSSILRFEDNERYGTEVEVEGLKGGTTKLYAKNLRTGAKAVYTVKVNKPAGYGISRVGSATKTVELGDDLELKVKKGSGLKNDQVKWYIVDTSLLRFEDGQRYGAEVEVEAIKRGTTKVYAHNLYSGAKAVYIVKVVPDYDD